MLSTLVHSAVASYPSGYTKSVISNLDQTLRLASWYAVMIVGSHSFNAVREFANKSAASAASPDFVKFQAVIKSATSAASRKTKNQGPRSREAHVHADDGARLGSPGSWSLTFGLPGGCASSRLDHGLKFYVIQGGCASSRLIHEFLDCASWPES